MLLEFWQQEVSNYHFYRNLFNLKVDLCISRLKWIKCIIYLSFLIEFFLMKMDSVEFCRVR